jgi:3-hydroxyisobutyrate dehydrogenase-like beta-hydroxyacid dehydrogenase
MPAEMEIGFIGLGAMGMPMARNLALKLEVRPRVYDANPQALEAASDWATICGSPKEVAERGGVIMSMLPADRHVREVALGPDGVIAAQAQDALYADFSTISPDTIQEVGARLAERGIKTVGGAVTLGVPAAQKGTLTVYVDGDEADVAAGRPAFSAFAETILHMGKLGNAKLIKLMNNYLAALNVALTGEALAIGTKAGIDVATLVKILEQGSADSFILRNHYEKFYLKDDIGPGKFGTDYMIKDVNILLDYCRRAHKPLMLGGVALSLYRAVSAAGYGKHYYPVILKWLQETTEVRG